MARERRKFDQEFKEGAVRIVRETAKPISRVARELSSIFNLRGRDAQLRIAPTDTGPAPPHRRTPTQSRTRVRPGPARHLARTRPGHHHRHHPLRHRSRDQLGPAAPAAEPPRVEHGILHAVSCRALGVSQAWFYKWRQAISIAVMLVGRLGHPSSRSR